MRIKQGVFFVLVLLEYLGDQAKSQTTKPTTTPKRIRGQPYVDKDGYTNKKGIFLPTDEYIHNPYQLTDYPYYQVPEQLPDYILEGNAFKVPGPKESPDFRLPEPYMAPYIKGKYIEENRYYRITPYSNIAAWKSNKGKEKPENLRCYCVCVYKRLTPLSMGAVLTARHILTTAVATDLVVRRYRNKHTLHNILGAWYETSHMKSTNSVVYMTPARIHYHPQWNPPDMTNRSFPFPCVYDLALWTSERPFLKKPVSGMLGNIFGSFLKPFVAEKGEVVLCERCSPGRVSGFWSSPVLGEKDLAIIVGVHMVMDIGRVPFPWFKYAVRTRTGKRNPCPKTEWGWFHCIEHVGMYPKFGVDSGAPLHITYEGYSLRYDGLAGINSFSMRLRSKHPVSYFTVLERYSVLDWLYRAYNGRQRYIYLDERFEDTQWAAPRLRPFNNNRLKEISTLQDEVGFDWAQTGKKKYVPIWWR